MKDARFACRIASSFVRTYGDKLSMASGNMKTIWLKCVMPFVTKFDLLKRPGTSAFCLVQGDIEKKSQVYREHWEAGVTEKIFPLISRLHPEMTGNITGMMLEMDNSELLMLLDSPIHLKAKVDEASWVLSGRS